MAGINIDFVADVGKFLGGAKQIESELDKVASSLDDLADDAKRAGKEAEQGLKEIKAKEARDNLRRLADEARDSGSGMEQYFTAAADEIDAELKSMASKAEDRLDDIADAAKTAGDGLDAGLTTGAKDAESAAESMESKFKEAFDKVATESKSAGASVGSEIKDGTDRAGDGMSEMADESAGTAREVAASFDGSAESIASGFQEVAANALAGFGPAGAAAGLAIAAGIGLGIKALQEMADEANESAEQVGELARELSDLDGNLSGVDFKSTMRDWAFEIKDSREWFEVWQKDAVNNLEAVADSAGAVGEDMSTFWQAMMSPDTDDSRVYLDGIKGKLGEVTDELERYKGMSSAGRGRFFEEEVAALEEQQAAWTTLTTELEASVTKKEKAYNQSVLLRSIEENVTEETIRQRDAVAEQAAAYEALLSPRERARAEAERAAEESATLRAAEENVTEEYLRQRDAVNGNNEAIGANSDLKSKAAELAGNAFLAEGEYTLAVDEATEKIRLNNEALADSETSELDRAKAIQSSREEVVGVAEDTRAYAQTMADSGRTQDEVNAILASGREKFLAAAEAAGINAEEADGLATSLGLVPGTVQTTMTFDNATAQSAIDAAKQTLGVWPASVTTKLALDDSALRNYRIPVFDIPTRLARPGVPTWI